MDIRVIQLEHRASRELHSLQRSAVRRTGVIRAHSSLELVAPKSSIVIVHSFVARAHALERLDNVVGVVTSACCRLLPPACLSTLMMIPRDLSECICA